MQTKKICFQHWFFDFICPPSSGIDNDNDNDNLFLLLGQIHANPVILGGLFANDKDMGRCLPMLNCQRNNKML